MSPDDEESCTSLCRRPERSVSAAILWGMHISSLDQKMSTRGESFKTWPQLIASPDWVRPHVVILGSGASAAAFPGGDANGKPVPTMATLVATLELSSILQSAGFAGASENFEVLYSRLCSDTRTEALRQTLEEKVYEYFAGLALPQEPTQYDLLLLSLRPKDVVATFNWDPFLFDAYERNLGRAPLPQFVHLHGNVRIGYCPSHPHQGRNSEPCPDCGKTFQASRLLFPIEKKNYSSDPLIVGEWKFLKDSLREAFTLTIFGYGAPSSDTDAVTLMRDAWKSASKREIHQIEVIDKKSRSEIWATWREFFVTQHCTVVETLQQSFIGRWPRRTCEGLIEPIGYGRPMESAPTPDISSFESVAGWLAPLVAAEKTRK